MDPTPLKQTIDLSSKAAIVTGGAMGIGFGIAYRLAEAGASVVVADLQKPAADEAVAKLVAKGWKATAVGADVSSPEQVSHMIDAAVSAYGGVDILVNNAGIYPTIPVLQMDARDFERILRVNLEGAFLCTKAAAERMIEQGRGGKIVNVTSIDALHPSMIGLATYDASKHGLWGFTKNVALELAPHKIWINAIAPGAINTPGTGADSGNKELQEMLKPFIARIPMHRMGEPDDIGKVALFLASDLSSYMTGSQIVVDGGVLLA
ncbi:MAG TPA: SDR family NAD(P)-dependent oxidoreductase [Candidatus Tyrphobacter sp.]